MDASGAERLRDQFTVGVEEEYQLVDPVSGELQNGGALVRQADRSGEVAGEVQDTMLEIGTPVCRDAREVSERLRERRFQASAAAASEDLEIVAAGTHPLSSWQVQVLTEGARPQMLSRAFRQLLQRQSIWGMHIHVAIPAHLERAVLMNTVRTFGPHLLALSCSSPFEVGTDTGFSSFRTVAWRGFPFVGVPPYFESDVDYRRFIDLLLQSGTIPDDRTVYWSVRPNPRYPTLELRMCDVCPRIADAVAITAFARAIVVAAAEGALKPLGHSLRESLQDEILRENEWAVARDGLEATIVVPESAAGGCRIRDEIERLYRVVAPFAMRLGDAESLEHVKDILAHGNSADQMRQHVNTSGNVGSAVEWLVEETRAGTGIDRRKRRRSDFDANTVSASQL